MALTLVLKEILLFYLNQFFLWSHLSETMNFYYIHYTLVYKCSRQNSKYYQPINHIRYSLRIAAAKVLPNSSHICSPYRFIPIHVIEKIYSFAKKG